MSRRLSYINQLSQPVVKRGFVTEKKWQ